MMLNQVSKIITDDQNDLVQRLRDILINNPAFERAKNVDKKVVFNQNWYLHAVLTSTNNDIDVAQAIILETLRWRSGFDIEYISILELKDLLESQIMYFHGVDNQNNSLLWLNLSKYNMVLAKQIEKLFIYWIDRHYFSTQATNIGVIINMNQASIHNMNLDFFKFFFKSFKYFYPSTLQSIYLMDTQLKLQPSWKIIKSWLDPSLLSVTHSVTSTSIRNYVAEEFVPRSLGGYDDFEFKMADLSRCISNTNSQTDSGYYENADQIPNLDMTMMRKTVSFGEEDECVARVSPLTMSAADGNKMITSVNGSLVGNSESERLSRKNSKGNLPPSVPPRSGSIKRNGHIPIHLRGLVEQKLNAPADDWFQNDFVAMIPSNEITLKSVESENDSVDIVILRNVSNETVFYKIKITSPEKFRVRPSTGILKPGAKEVIRLYLQNEYKNNISKDKFLLMAMAVEENASFDNFSKIWSQKSDDKKIERKIKCTVEDGSADRNIVSSMKKHSLSSSPVNSIYESNELKSIIKTQNIILLLLAVICIIQVVMLVKVFGSSDLSINNHDLCPKAVSNDLPLADQLTSSLPFQNDEL